MSVDRLLESLGRPGAQLAALYVVTGDDPLLTIEAADALRAVAKAAGYLERNSFLMDARSDWSALGMSAQSGSLFGDKQLVEVSLPTGKPGKLGAEAQRCQRWRGADHRVTATFRQGFARKQMGERTFCSGHHARDAQYRTCAIAKVD